MRKGSLICEILLYTCKTLKPEKILYEEGFRSAKKRDCKVRQVGGFQSVTNVGYKVRWMLD